jgi:RNA polymerase sigma-70 factor (ECF subfamily)
MTSSANAETQFKEDLVALIPHMRAFARSLCRDATHADDLAQDALAKAWASRASYTMGTNLKAWTFMILRNQFYSEKRRSWRSQPLDQEVAERTLIAVTSADGRIELDDLRRAMLLLPTDQREALILVGAGGLAYEEAAATMGVAVGTVKSRVSRARKQLTHLMETQRFATDGAQPGAAMDTILEEFKTLRSAA